MTGPLLVPVSRMRLDAADADLGRMISWVRSSRRGRRSAGARLRSALVAFLVLWACVAISPALIVSAQKQPPPRIGEFMWGIAGQESGWDYYARNSSSGAFGKYQIMLENWPSWAARYIGDSLADPNPLNQELVARGKMAGLYDWLGSWKRVAYWWLTGDTTEDSSLWSATAQRYVFNVLSLARRAPRGGSPLPVDTADANGIPMQRGEWRVLLEPARLFDSNSVDHIALRWVPAKLFVTVRRAEWGPLHQLIWLKVDLPNGKIGWLAARKTLPAGPPKKAEPPQP